MHAQLLSHVQLFVSPYTIAHQAPLSMGFSRQEYWSGLPFPPPGDLPNPGIKQVSPALAGRFFITEPRGKPICPGQTCTLGHARCRWLSSGLQAPPGAQRQRSDPKILLTCTLGPTPTSVQAGKLHGEQSKWQPVYGCLGLLPAPGQRGQPAPSQPAGQPQQNKVRVGLPTRRADQEQAWPSGKDLSPRQRLRVKQACL